MGNTLKNALKRAIPNSIREQIRLRQAAKNFKEVYFGDQLRTILPLVLKTGETHNFTYDLTETNLRYLSEMIGVATSTLPSIIESYIDEAIQDQDLRAYFDRMMASHDGQKSPANTSSPFGRRLGWYAAARAVKPRIVIETGVERGHGALLLCAALLRNQREGFPGRYFGTDINPQAGWLLSGQYASVGKLLFGDSLTSLRGFAEPIDLFINDSDHSAEYEGQEYEVIAPKLSKKAIVLADNAHVTDKLAVFSRTMGRNFLMFREQPKDHWYPGAGIGISFPRNNVAPQP